MSTSSKTAKHPVEPASTKQPAQKHCFLASDTSPPTCYTRRVQQRGLATTGAQLGTHSPFPRDMGWPATTSTRPGSSLSYRQRIPLYPETPGCLAPGGSFCLCKASRLPLRFSLERWRPKGGGP